MEHSQQTQGNYTLTVLDSESEEEQEEEEDLYQKPIEILAEEISQNTLNLTVESKKSSENSTPRSKTPKQISNKPSEPYKRRMSHVEWLEQKDLQNKQAQAKKKEKNPNKDANNSFREKLKEIQRSVNEKKLFNRKDEQFLESETRKMEINRRKSLDLSNMRNDRHLKMLEKLHKKQVKLEEKDKSSVNDE